MKIKGRIYITVGIQKSVAITYLSEQWEDGTESDCIMNDIADLGAQDFLECLDVDLNEQIDERIIDFTGDPKIYGNEIEWIEYSVTPGGGAPTGINSTMVG